MKKEIAKEISVWFLTNVVVPFGVPLLFVLLWSWVCTVNISSWIQFPFEKGIYTFFVITVQISLLQDYNRETSKSNAFNPVFWVPMMFCFLFTFLIFGNFLECTPKHIELTTIIVITISLLFFALYCKYKITKIKYTPNNK